MEPTLYPTLDALHQVIAVTGQSLILFENNTYLLIRDDETIDSIVSQIQQFVPSKMVNINIHFYVNHDIMLFMQPDYPAVGYLKIVKKESQFDVDTEKENAIRNILKDMQEKKIVVDGRTENLKDYEVSMTFVVNSSLNMGKGKIAGQVGHAVETLIEDLLKKPTQEYIDWKNSLRRKIVLKATEEEIRKFLDAASKEGGNGQTIDTDTFIVVRDAGLTQIDPGSLTVLGFVPMRNRNRPDFLKNLKLL